MPCFSRRVSCKLDPENLNEIIRAMDKAKAFRSRLFFHLLNNVKALDNFSKTRVGLGCRTLRLMQNISTRIQRTKEKF